MLHAKYPPKVSEDTVLSYTLSSPVCPDYNRLTIFKNGSASGQKDCRDDNSSFEYKIFGDVDEFLAEHLPTVKFLELTENYYEIPSDRTSGKATNLYYYNSPTNSSHWLGIWNYGRGDIPLEVVAGMYSAVENLALLLMEESSKDNPESSSNIITTPWSSSTGFLYVVAIATAHSVFSNVCSLLRRRKRRSSNSKI